MPAFKVELFGGMAPAVDSKFLPVNGAAYAVNAWLDVGVLTGFNALKEVVTAPLPATSIGKAYRIPLDYDTPYRYDESYYMFFDNPDTDIIRGATHGDTYDRYYWASSTSPPQYNTRDRIIAADPPWLLGIVTPPSGMTVTATLGSGTAVTRAYAVTFVSEYGEEGAPSPPVLENGFPDSTWTLNSIPVPAAADMGVDRNITKKRIYRTVTSSTGIASFFMVAEIPATDTTYVDTTPDADITGNKLMDSMFYTPPPSDLQGFCMGPNGVLASWRGSEVWFSEPYRPHAWPVTYVLTMEYPIVGMASIANVFYVLTRGYPVTIVGSTPTSMLPAKVTVFEPCASRGGIVTFPEGVYYPSGNGLILLQAGAATNITKTLITKEGWQTYMQGARFRAGRLGTAYYGYGTVQFGVFQSDAFQTDAFASEDYSGALNGIFIDPLNTRLGLILLQSEEPVNNVVNDAWSSELSVIKGKKVYWLNLIDAEQTIEKATWHSKDFQMPWPFNFAAAKIFFDTSDNTPPQNPVRDTTQDQEFSEGKYGIIRWYGDDRLLAVHEIRERGELLRLPSETKYDYFRFEIETVVEITSVHVASSSKALREV